jgi:hypothetical protein
MNRKMRDDEFEALLGHALKAEAAPASLMQRMLHQRAVAKPHWLMAFLSPARIAACAGLMSLSLGFALGAGNAAVAEDTDTTMAAALYIADDIGDL